MACVVSPRFSDLQRYVALGYGALSLTLFAGAVVVAIHSLYRGLDSGLIHLSGPAALGLDVFLIAQFALGHSWLLSDPGRRFIARLAPLGLGSPLSTTIFTALASVQLTATFLLWSPSGVIWAAPEGWIKVVMTVFYGLSWLLLAKSMGDAGLGVQIGTIGWLSVWRNEKPRYKPFSRAGLFRLSRQPIYVAFALILWTAPVWTPDHVLMAVTWTIYLVLAPVFKERRYLRYYGDAFERYRQKVPYWIPGLRLRPQRSKNPVHSTEAPEHQVAIAGGGVVGLLLAALLGSRGIRVVVIDQRTGPSTDASLIRLSGSSLDLLAGLGLEDSFRQFGVRIETCHLHGTSGSLGRAWLRDGNGRRSFILSVARPDAVHLLEERVGALPTVTVISAMEVRSVRQDDESVTLGLASAGELEESGLLKAEWLVACDGRDSPIREMLRMRTAQGRFPGRFVGGVCEDRSGLKTGMDLFFNELGAMASIPLPGGQRRWIVPAGSDRETPLDVVLGDAVLRCTGQAPLPGDWSEAGAYPGEWLQSEQFFDGRVILCGEAGGFTVPVVGQGIDLSWGDAGFAADLLEAVLMDGQSASAWLRAYDQGRRKAGSRAIRVGIRCFRLASWSGNGRLREHILRLLVGGNPVRRWIRGVLGLLTVPIETPGFPGTAAGRLGDGRLSGGIGTRDPSNR